MRSLWNQLNRLVRVRVCCRYWMECFNIHSRSIDMKFTQILSHYKLHKFVRNAMHSFVMLCSRVLSHSLSRTWCFGMFWFLGFCFSLTPIGAFITALRNVVGIPKKDNNVWKWVYHKVWSHWRIVRECQVHAEHRKISNEIKWEGKNTCGKKEEEEEEEEDQ